jgi:hypothetical protein
MPRVTAAAEKLGLKSCGSYDILSGQDLMCPMTRKKVRERLQTLKPKLLVICPPCGPFSPLQNLNKHVNMKEWLKKRYQGRILLRYVMDLLEDQIKRGDIGLFEHPKNAKSWEDRHVMRLRKLENMHEVVVDQCRFGLKDRVSKKFHKKETRIMVNSECMARRLNKRCHGLHEHEHVMGMVKLDGKWQSRSRDLG